MERKELLRIIVVVELAVLIILMSAILLDMSKFSNFVAVETKTQVETVEETEPVEETTKQVVESKKNKEETKKVEETEDKETEKELEKVDIEKEANMVTTKEGKKWVKVDEYTFFEIGRNDQYSKVSMYDILKEFGTKGTVAGKSGYMYNGKFWYEIAPSEFAEMK